MTREQLAREAFYGCRPALLATVQAGRAYQMDGETHASNGMTLAECIAAVQQMDAAQFEAANEIDNLLA